MSDAPASDPAFHGVWPYLVSPIDRDGRVMDNVLSDLVEHLIEAGVHGLTPLGSTGEFAYLSAEQKQGVVEVTLAAARGRVPVVAGVAATTIDDAVRQATLYDLCREGRYEEAMALQRKLWRINQVFSKFALAACIKGGLELQGFPVGAPLAPQPALDEAGRAEVKAVLDILQDLV